MAYFFYMAVVALMFSGAFVASIYDDAKRGDRESKIALRCALAAIFLSPLAGIWIPLGFIFLVLWGIYSAIRVAFK